MKRLFLQIFAWLAILLGVGLMLQPTVSRFLTEQKSTKTVQKFVQAAEAAAPAAPETSAAEPARAYPELYDAFLAYNQQLFAQGQSGLKDPFAYETPAFDLTGCGLPDDVIAALWIPRLDLELPVYLGANAANMARCWGRPPCRWAAKTPTPSLPPTAAITARKCCATCSRYKSATKLL